MGYTTSNPNYLYRISTVGNKDTYQNTHNISSGNNDYKQNILFLENLINYEKKTITWQYC